MVDLDQYDLAFSATIITMEWFQATKRRVGAETGVDHIARTHTYHHSHHFLAWWLQWPLRRARIARPNFPQGRPVLRQPQRLDRLHDPRSFRHRSSHRVFYVSYCSGQL